MTLKLESKKAIVADVAKIADGALSLVAAEYRGISVPDMTNLRRDARNAGVTLRIVRNTLAIRALKGTTFEPISERLKGPIMLAFSGKDISAAAKVLRNFMKTNEKLQVKALSLQGKVLDSTHLEAVAKLPSFEEAIAKMLSCMKAPITTLVRTMAEPHAKLVRTLAAIRDKKQAQSS